MLAKQTHDYVIILIMRSRYESFDHRCLTLRRTSLLNNKKLKIKQIVSVRLLNRQVID